MGEYDGVKVENIFNTMEKRFISLGALGVDAVFGYKITGDHGGTWKLTISDGTMDLQVVQGALEGCTTEIIADAEAFVGVNVGKFSVADAMAGGRLSIEGDATVIGNILPKIFLPFIEDIAGGEQGEELICLSCVPTIRQRFATGPVMGKWLKGLGEKKFYANRCPKCGRTQTPPREICADCRVRCTEFAQVGPGGTVTLIDKVMFASPDPLTGKVRSTPYAMIFMVLDGCTPGDSFSHELKRSDIDRIQSGMKVRPVWAEERTGGYNDLLYFEIDQ